MSDLSQSMVTTIINALIEWENFLYKAGHAFKSALMVAGSALIGGLTLGPIGIVAASAACGTAAGLADRPRLRNFARMLNNVLSNIDRIWLAEIIIGTIPQIIYMITEGTTPQHLMQLAVNITSSFLTLFVRQNAIEN